MRFLQHPAVAWSAFAAALAVNLGFMYAPRVPGPPSEIRLDLIGHAVTFAALTFTGLLTRIPPRWLLVGVGVNAVASEVVQHLLLADRSGDPTDLAADAVGIALGYLAWRLLLRPRLRPADDARAPRADGP